ncbi:hypothetical protein Q4S45_08410 [Massilia sp. R2A-15]|uniref:hypothetical protein n=1 Tax=Massilia sp. R2A-15 TaxID=3064278 RepID=UPI0027332171|nr:hypothetical protein [Massilia sp. R2A-15]WLI91128.1 hypothetical protein Q4S45_08410 [Massilia sp. R2A-15]
MPPTKTKVPTPPRRRVSANAAPVVKSIAAPPPYAVAAAADVDAPVVARSKRAPKQENRLKVSHRMTASQSALLDELKSRSVRLGHAAKKGDVIFAGLQLLNRLSEKGFEAAILPLLATPKFKKNAARKKPATQPKA